MITSKLAAKLSEKRVQEALTPAKRCCSRGDCLKHFNTTLLLRWRKMWYALPSADRQRRLADMFYEERARQVAFKFRGLRTCFHAIRLRADCILPKLIA